MSCRKLQLFVWDGFSPDYTDGLAFAIAYSEEEARQLIVEAYGASPSDWGTLKVHPLNRHIAYAVCGGG